MFGLCCLRRWLGSLAGPLLMACEGGPVWLLLWGHLLEFGMHLSPRHSLGDGSGLLSKLLRKLFEMLACIELAAYFVRGWVLGNQVLEVGMLQVVLQLVKLPL
jgi:hypothetical protein